MMKRVLVLLLLLAGLIAGCGDINAPLPAETEPLYSDTLTDARRTEINWYYSDLPPSAFAYDDENTVAGKRFYGTYNGYTVLFSAGSLTVVSRRSIGGKEFKWPFGGLALVCYKDGTVFDLAQIYETGSITDSDLQRIFEKHVAYFTSVTGISDYGGY